MLCVFIRIAPSNEYTLHAIINIEKKIIQSYPKFNHVFTYGLYLEFEVEAVNEPSVFQPLKSYSTCKVAVTILNPTEKSHNN